MPTPAASMARNRNLAGMSNPSTSGPVFHSIVEMGRCELMTINREAAGRVPLVSDTTQEKKKSTLRKNCDAFCLSECAQVRGVLSSGILIDSAPPA
jgi:hypothetical protein